MPCLSVKPVIHRRPKLGIRGVIFFYIQRNVTCDIYYYLAIELDHAKRDDSRSLRVAVPSPRGKTGGRVRLHVGYDSRLAAYRGVVLQRLEGLNL